MNRFGAFLLVTLLGSLAPSLTGAQRPDRQHRGVFLRVLILPDTSGSLDSREYVCVIRSLADQLATLAEDTGAEEIGVLPWAGPGDALRSAHWVRLPRRPRVPAVDVHFSEGETIFRGARQHREQRERAAAETRRAEEELRWTRERTTALQPLVARLREAQQGVAACSDIHGVLQRCRRERVGTLALVITDAAETCHPELLRTSDAGGATTLLILVPPRASAGTASLSVEDRIAWIRKSAPGVTVIPSFLVSADPSEWLLEALPPPRRALVSEAAGSSR
jgi:hypothetical protein